LDSGVGGAGVDEGQAQARVNRFVVIAPCPRRHPQPDAVLLKSHCGFACCRARPASLRLSRPRVPPWQLAARRSTRLWTWSLCSQKAPTTILAESTKDFKSICIIFFRAGAPLGAPYLSTCCSRSGTHSYGAAVGRSLLVVVRCTDSGGAWHDGLSCARSTSNAVT
jgi:hypothetical protein